MTAETTHSSSQSDVNKRYKHAVSYYKAMVKNTVDIERLKKQARYTFGILHYFTITTKHKIFTTKRSKITTKCPIFTTKHKIFTTKSEN